METFKRNASLSMLVIITSLALVSCGDDDNKKKAAEPTLWAKAVVEERFECESRSLDLTVQLELRSVESPLIRGDQMAQVIIETPTFELQMDLLLGFRFRTNRDIIEVRESLLVRNPDLRKTEDNLFLKDEPEFAPHVLDYNLVTRQMEIVSDRLKRVIRFGLASDFDDRDRSSRSRVRDDERVNSSGSKTQPMLLSCE